MILDYSGGPNIIRRGFTGWIKRQRVEIRGEDVTVGPETWWCEKDCLMLLALEVTIGGPGIEEWRRLWEARKGKGTDSS